MPTQNIVQSVRTAFESAGRGDTAKLIDLLAPDVVYTLIGDTAFSGVFRGRDAVVSKLFGPLGQQLAEPMNFETTRTFSFGSPNICASTLRRFTTPCDDSYRVSVSPSQTATVACGSRGLCVSAGVT